MVTTHSLEGKGREGKEYNKKGLKGQGGEEEVGRAVIEEEADFAANRARIGSGRNHRGECD